MEKKIRHWQQIVISACEQSGRAVVPDVSAPIKLGDWIDTVEADCKLVLHPETPADLSAQSPSSAALLIGPEGGLSDEEIIAAESKGFQRLQLGPRVLRTETAPTAALAVLGIKFGDLQSR